MSIMGALIFGFLLGFISGGAVVTYLREVRDEKNRR
jgi:hypothetical protein